MKKKIEVYTNSTCGHCAQLKKALKEANIKFTEKEAGKNQKEWGLTQMITGLGMFPTVKAGDNYLVPGRDFNTPEQAVQKLQNIENLDKLSNDIKLLEAFKTLTFSINNGFQRVFQQLNELQTKLNTEENEHKSTS